MSIRYIFSWREARWFLPTVNDVPRSNGSRHRPIGEARSAVMDDRRLRTLNRANLGIFVLLCLLFWLNVLFGKAQISFGWQVPFLLSDIAEFPLLLVTAPFFTLAAIGRENLLQRERGEK